MFCSQQALQSDIMRIEIAVMSCLLAAEMRSILVQTFQLLLNLQEGVKSECDPHYQGPRHEDKVGTCMTSLPLGTPNMFCLGVANQASRARPFALVKVSLTGAIVYLQANQKL